MGPQSEEDENIDKASADSPCQDEELFGSSFIENRVEPPLQDDENPLKKKQARFKKNKLPI